MCVCVCVCARFILHLKYINVNCCIEEYLGEKKRSNFLS